MSSTYADHPTKGVMSGDPKGHLINPSDKHLMHRNSTIDYKPTEESQAEKNSV